MLVVKLPPMLAGRSRSCRQSDSPAPQPSRRRPDHSFSILSDSASQGLVQVRVVFPRRLWPQTLIPSR